MTTTVRDAAMRTAKAQYVTEDYQSVPEHVHRRPKKQDFEGKTVKRFERTADNVWRLWFTDGTAFAIETEITGSMCPIPFMRICDLCVKD